MIDDASAELTDSPLLQRAKLSYKDNVNHNVNVMDCTFNNIPATSNKIFVSYQNTDKTVWKLVTDVPSAEINSVVRYW